MSHDWREVDGFRFVATIPNGESGPDGPIETSLFACEVCGAVVVGGYLVDHFCSIDPYDPDA